MLNHCSQTPRHDCYPSVPLFNLQLLHLGIDFFFFSTLKCQFLHQIQPCAVCYLLAFKVGSASILIELLIFPAQTFVCAHCNLLFCHLLSSYLLLMLVFLSSLLLRHSTLTPFMHIVAYASLETCNLTMLLLSPKCVFLY